MALKAGCFTAEITPADNMLMAGEYGTVRASTGAHDPLLASALHLRSGAQGLLVASLDLMYLSPPWTDYIRRSISAHTGIREDNILLGSTMNHSGPACVRQMAWQSEEQDGDALARYLEAVRNRTVAVAARACATTRPAAVAWSSVSLRGAAVSRFRPAGPVDAEAGCLSVIDSATGLPMAVVPVCGIPASAAGSESTLYSADYVHYLRVALAEKYGGLFTVVPLAAPCADLSPASGGVGFEGAEKTGRMIGDAIAAEFARIGRAGYSDEIAMSSRCAAVELARAEFPSMWDAKVRWGERRAELEKAQNDGAPEAVLAAARGSVRSAEGLMSLVGAASRGVVDAAWPAYRAAEVQAIVIRDAALVGMPGELCSFHAGEIKRNCSGRVFVAGCVNGELQGCLGCGEPDDTAAPAMANSLHAPGSAGLLVNAAVGLLSGRAASQDLVNFRTALAGIAEMEAGAAGLATAKTSPASPGPATQARIERAEPQTAIRSVRQPGDDPPRKGGEQQ